MLQLLLLVFRVWLLLGLLLLLVLVLEMVLEPGESDRPHDHRDETVYFQKGGSLRITLPGGDAMDVTVPDGHVMWHEAWSHQVTNTGTRPVMAIIVEEKP